MRDSGGMCQHRGTRAVQRMVEFAPSTGGLALWVKHHDVEDPQAAEVATDGKTLFYGPAFERLPRDEQVGLVAHEVLHIALRHTQRFSDLQRRLGDVDLPLFNICADAIVNSTLGEVTWMRLPPKAVTLEQLLATAGITESVEKSLLEWDVERLYRAIDDRREGPRARGRQPAGRSPQGGAAPRADGPRSSRARALGAGTKPDLVPGPAADGTPETQAEEAREWSERIVRAHAGDGAHSMLRALIADLPRTRTPWEQVLRTRLARGLSARTGISWSRPLRSYIANQGRIGTHGRLPWEPSFGAKLAAPRLVVIIDVSGSIDAALLERFAREIEAITRRLEAAVVLVVGDDRVRRVTRFEPGRAKLGALEFSGGGGTDFTPLLEEAERHHPDLVVVLTDLDGPARYRPRWPVIWAVPETHQHAVQPFGRKLTLA
jgi:predicted metal-dependent peptidase